MRRSMRAASSSWLTVLVGLAFRLPQLVHLCMWTLNTHSRKPFRRDDLLRAQQVVERLSRVGGSSQLAGGQRALLPLQKLSAIRHVFTAGLESWSTEKSLIIIVPL